MSDWSGGGDLLIQAAVRDTMYVVQVGDGGWFATVTGVADGLVDVLLLVLVAVLVIVVWKFRTTHRRVNELVDRIQGEVGPLVRHANAVADNVDYITTSIRVDVQQVNRTIATANEALRETIEETHRRVREFHALLDVVRDEAEDVFVSTASAVRGARTGASVFSDDEELEEDEEPGSGFHSNAPDEPYGSEEVTNGYDSSYGREGRGAAPRRKPR